MCKGKENWDLMMLIWGEGVEAAPKSSKTSSGKGTCFAQALRLSGTYVLISGNYKAKLKYKSSY